ncbi:HD domain-containing protein [Kribbella turkmenica]|uniref:HD domain-containing protein n=1 Tax=Kribbella turkmenica TaxID=2530375 RepID=A0A4R4X891_9ACTN|nr:HD domain-containing phosphohydrolase [Kribbella turkmenica]TDD26693.1 HD domain-containing protein [Kribbella turkmenica]
MGPQDPRLAELLCALSVALDLAMAQPPEKSIRSCLVAARLADRLDVADKRTVYYATLLRHLGCTATTHEEVHLMGPRAAELRPLAERTDTNSPRESLRYLTQVGKGTGIKRLQYVARTLTTGEDDVLRAICEVGSMLAERLGLGPGTAQALYQNLERWDGKGKPKGLAGTEIHIATRIAEVATQAVIVGGDTMRQRKAGWLDPEIVAAYDDRLTADLDKIDVWQATLDAEPQPWRHTQDLDELARTFADFVDLKSPYLFGHSTGVATLADEAARLLHLDDSERATLRRAALLHDLGRVAVPTAVWERSGPLRRADWEQVRLHPYQSERILARSPALEPIAVLAAMHHERLDGSGYPRQAKGGELSTSARILAAADCYQALTQDRPHRSAHSPEGAAELMLAQVAAGKLDGRCVKAVLAAAGQQVPGRRLSRPAGLTEREIDVLRLLARGSSNADIARELVVSRRTAEHHVQHIYGKIGVSTRAAAALFAMQHGLFTQ